MATAVCAAISVHMRIAASSKASVEQEKRSSNPRHLSPIHSGMTSVDPVPAGDHSIATRGIEFGVVDGE